MKAAEEIVEDGTKINLALHHGNFGSRHLCIRLLTMCGVERPVTEIACRACGGTARRFRQDAKADGWSDIYYSHGTSRQN